MQKAIAEATASALQPDAPKRRRRRGGRGRSVARARTTDKAEPEAVNEPASFLQFVIDHRLGTEVEGTVDAFASHGAFVNVDGVRCYVPLSAMGNPQPTRARDVLTKDETRTFVVQAVDAPRRGIELGLPGFATVAGAPSEETVAAEVGTRRSQAKKDAGEEGRGEEGRPKKAEPKKGEPKKGDAKRAGKAAKPKPGPAEGRRRRSAAAPTTAAKKTAGEAGTGEADRRRSRHGQPARRRRRPTKKSSQAGTADRRRPPRSRRRPPRSRRPPNRHRPSPRPGGVESGAPAPMIFEQFYLECLSHASYLVGDETTGHAVVVDPQTRRRDLPRDTARERGLTIERVIETHLHADFLSGHLELANETGAVISLRGGRARRLPD